MGEKYKNIFKNIFGKKRDISDVQDLPEEYPALSETVKEENKKNEEILAEPLQIIFNTWAEETGKEILYRPVSDYLSENAYDIEDAELFAYDLNIKKFLFQLK